MCGLGGFYRFDSEQVHPADGDEMENLLCLIEDRGGHSYGYAMSVGRSVHVKHFLGRPSEAPHHFIAPIPEDFRFVMMHTRYATKGDIRDHRNTHPLRYHGSIVAHNGVLRNDDAIFHKTGVKRQAAVDSEAINAAIQTWGPEGAFCEIQGSASVVWMDEERPDELFLWTNGRNPLAVGWFGGLFVWASREDHLWSLGAEQIQSVQPWTIVHLTPDGVETYGINAPLGAVKSPMQATRSSRVF